MSSSVTLVVEAEQISVPVWVRDLATFRQWANTAEFPDHGRICFFDGEVWIDLSKEQIFTHAALKGEFNRVLGGLSKTEQLGRYFPDGIALTNVTADLFCVPDGTFVSFASFANQAVRLVAGATEGFTEIEGTPEMTLEIVSTSSVRKDKVTLRQSYWEAGVQEYWLVDARRQPIQFDILRSGARGFAVTRKQEGWVKSQVFARSFRLLSVPDPCGHPEFTLETR